MGFEHNVSGNYRRLTLSWGSRRAASPTVLAQTTQPAVVVVVVFAAAATVAVAVAVVAAAAVVVVVVAVVVGVGVVVSNSAWHRKALNFQDVQDLPERGGTNCDVFLDLI
ncbi:unnamed protein product [Polarella glacialis]|uniref:Uncharacterized protein n=1 Tax=Polarella glacialis TaxID=89957 RepID=A0A813IL66_POLGL|nr:unnamed protein product [Polarella glacialis]